MTTLRMVAAGFAGGVLGCVAVLGAMGAGAPGGVGRVVATSFTLVDEAGKTRILMSVPKEGPLLLMLDEGGKARLGVSAQPHGQTGLTLVDANGKFRFVLMMEEDGKVSMRMKDGDGVQLWRAP